jgi:heme/copper-type cytochrome/quinol oxidase subunit 2
MRAFVRVVSAEEFDEWVADQDPIPEGEEGLQITESEFDEPAGTTNEPPESE